MEQPNKDIVESIPSWKLEKQKAKAEKLKLKVIKFDLELQFEELTNQGFTDSKKVFKALKKSKGDIVAASALLKLSPTDDGNHKWKKYLKNRTPSEEERHKESKKSRKVRTPSEEARKLDRRMKKLSTTTPRDSCEESKPRKWKQERTREEELQRKEKKHANALARLQEKNPDFESFNNKMIALGFSDVKKNYAALKKKEGNQETAAIHLRLKQHLQNISHCESLSKQRFQTLYLDCNNCFYLDQSFLKKAKNGNFREIEEKITHLMKLFQSKYGSDIRIVLVFDNSKLVSDATTAERFLTPTFEMITARPKFESADDLLVSLAERAESNDDSIYVTSDRMLQARLIDAKVKNIMTSKVLFSQLKNDYLGQREFSAVVEV